MWVKEPYELSTHEEGIPRRSKPPNKYGEVFVVCLGAGGAILLVLGLVGQVVAGSPSSVGGCHFSCCMAFVAFAFLVSRVPFLIGLKDTKRKATMFGSSSFEHINVGQPQGKTWHWE